MLKRLIEVALPLKEVSEQSAREKSIRHGHISTLHIWWARRPLAACRAVVFASLIPDPDDPECPQHFRDLVMELLKGERFRPDATIDYSTDANYGKKRERRFEDTPRNRCLEFIKHLVKWENSNKPEYIEPARKLIAAAHKFLHPGAEGEAPKVLDPFAGGGAIPLEALRLGCEAHAIDLNPVAHLIELCTLVYPQKYGQPDSRPLPDYIKRLIAHNRANKEAKGGSTLFEMEGGEAVVVRDDEIFPDVEITEAEYRKNPLAADVKYWAHWTATKTVLRVGQFYPSDSDGSVPVAYLWARTAKCPNPQCYATIPLVRQTWLCRAPKRRIAMRPHLNMEDKTCSFNVVAGKSIDFDPDQGFVIQGQATCPFCHTSAGSGYLQSESRADRLGHQLMAVVLTDRAKKGKRYRKPTESDLQFFRNAANFCTEHVEATFLAQALSNRQPRLMWVQLYGLNTFRSLFNARQLVFLKVATSIVSEMTKHPQCEEQYWQALLSYLGLVIDRVADRNSSICRWQCTGEKIANVFCRQGMAMVWDYVENNPLANASGNWRDAVGWVCDFIIANNSGSPANVARGSATRIPSEENFFDAIFTDPPYYDAVPYADLSDFFYVLLRQSLAIGKPDLFRTPLTPKADELIEERPHKSIKERKDSGFYERGMAKSFAEIKRTLLGDGIAWVMFAHKTTSAWETLVGALQASGLSVSASWPLHTEMMGRMIALGTASLASSVTLVCRQRSSDKETGLWDDVRKELQQVVKERLDFFWSQGIRGADFFISAIGPALSVFGKYEKVTKLSGEEVTVGQFLDEVRGLVTNYALAKILKTTHTANIDPESRFYVVWKWSYGEAKVPADESFKLAQALGMDTEMMWDRTGILEKAGENVLAVPVAKRMKIKDLGEPNADSTPASLIDVLHRMCVFRDKGDTTGMAEFLSRSGQGKNPALWLVAQAVSEILPDGDKEKQLMQGLLNQREKLEPESGVLF